MNSVKVQYLSSGSAGSAGSAPAAVGRFVLILLCESESAEMKNVQFS